MLNTYTRFGKVKSLKNYMLLEKILSENDILILSEGSDNLGFVIEVQECQYDKALKLIGDKCGINFEWISRPAQRTGTEGQKT